MARRKDFRRNYENLYPGIEKYPDVLSYLKKSDRKMEYMEIDLKSGHYIYDLQRQRIHYLPGREDSFERLIEEDHIQFSSGSSTENMIIQKMEYHDLIYAISLLSKAEQRLIYLRYWMNKSQIETAVFLSLTQQGVSYREKKILHKLRSLLKNL